MLDFFFKECALNYQKVLKVLPQLKCSSLSYFWQ